MSKNDRSPLPAVARGLVLFALAAPGAFAADDPPQVRWDARAAEHLLNRAGFGAPPSEIEAAVEAGLEATVRALVTREGRDPLPFFAERLSLRDGVMAEERRAALDGDQEDGGMESAAFREDQLDRIRELHDADVEQRDRFLAWWVERMRDGDDPLGERMTLFWHGWFTSSWRDVKSSYEMIEQNQLLRTCALGHFSDLLFGIARDPAMLEYLDNDANRRRKPNENFARELLELFTLGEGNYTESDVKAAARAFTGWTDEHGVFRFEWRRHDFDHKAFLGHEGRLDGDDVIEILLEQETCARRLAGELIRTFEGLAPSEERLATYAALLLESDYDLARFLEALFLDPEFYRDEAVGTRIAGPIDFLVGSARRLGVAPPGRALVLGAGALGQRLFDPPNVRGWEGGEAWVTTGSLLARSNLVGAFLGLVDRREQGPDRPRALRALRRARWSPELNLSAGLRRAHRATDEDVADHLLDELLAVPPTAEARGAALEFLARERERLGLADGELLEARRETEHVLRRLAHLILSLPEANLD